MIEPFFPLNLVFLYKKTFGLEDFLKAVVRMRNMPIISGTHM